MATMERSSSSSSRSVQSSSMRVTLEEDTVIREENELLDSRLAGNRAVRTGAGVVTMDEEAAGLQPFAVSFSGGGVRSAAFCSGALWALAKAGRLKNVTHISSVSGGSIAASSFASFLLAKKEGPKDEDVDRWYLKIVAELIMRCQRNAGYLLTFRNVLSFPQDASSWLPRFFDAVYALLVVIAVIVGAPTIFCIFYIVPLSLLVEAYFGGFMRNAFCEQPQPGQADWGSLNGLLILLQADIVRRLIGTIIGLVLVVMVLAALTPLMNPPPPREAPCKRHAYLVWRSLIAMSSRWLVLSALLLMCLMLVQAAEGWDQSQVSAHRCLDFYIRQQEVMSCQTKLAPNSSCFRDPSFVSVSALHRMQETTGPDVSRQNSTAMFSMSKQDTGLGFIYWFFFGMVVAFCVGLTFKALGWFWLWNTFLVLLSPMCFVWPASFVLQFRAFGPVTHQPLVTPVYDIHAVSQYSTESWNRFATASLIAAMFFMPFFNSMHRFVHYYFKVSLRRAFYHGGEDVQMSDVAECDWVPILLFGATLNEFCRPEDKEPHAVFVLSQRIMGCVRTKFLRAPNWLTLSECMTLSCAAIDGFVLTKLNRWHTRLLLAILSMAQGDWLRFDTGQGWHDLYQRVQRLHPRIANRLMVVVDRAPECCFWWLIFVLLILTNNNSIMRGDDDCSQFKWYRGATTGLLAVIVGVLSFFPQVPFAQFLLASPIIRQIHMFLIHYMVTDTTPMYLYISDGGPVEDLGVVELLRRKKRWILSLDTGDDPNCDLIDLRNAIQLAKKEKVCNIFDPREPRRDLDDLLEEYACGREKFLHLGVLYSAEEGQEAVVGDIFHVRMRLTEAPGEMTSVGAEIRRSEILQACAASPSNGAPSPTRQEHVEHHLHPRRSSRPEAEPQVEMAELDSAPGAATAKLGIRLISEEEDQEDPPPPSVPRGQLGGVCCDCCHSWCGHASCGAFPHTHTVNQFFTPLMWANFCRLGFELAQPAIAALTVAQQEEAKKRREWAAQP